MFRLLLFFEDSYQYLQDKVAHESSWWWLLHNFSQCFLSSFYSLTGYTIIMPSPSLPIQRELALIQKNIFYRFIWTMVESSCVSPHKIYQCHILFDNSYSSSRYQPKSGVSWIPAQIWRSVWTIACIWCSDAGQLHKISATDGDRVGFMETAKIPKDGLPNHGQTLWMQFCIMCTYMQIKCIVWTHIIHCVEDVACIWTGTHLKTLSVTLKSKSHQHNSHTDEHLRFS